MDMKSIIFVPLLMMFFFFSEGCSNSVSKNKNATADNTQSQSTSNKNENNKFVKGVVTTEYQNDGCALLIKTEIKGETVLFEPMTLDEKYKVNGKEIEFTYRTSRAKRNTCRLGSLIIIGEVK